MSDVELDNGKLEVPSDGRGRVGSNASSHRSGMDSKLAPTEAGSSNPLNGQHSSNDHPTAAGSEDEWKQRRATLRMQLTKQTKIVDEFYRSSSPDIDDLAYEIRSLESLCNKYNEVAGEMLLQFNLEENGTQYAAADRILFKANRLLHRLEGHERQSAHSEASACVGESLNTRGLPKIPLPTFSGGYLQWRPFWDTFASLVDRKSLPDVDKFIYLRQSLHGQAKKAISGLSACDASYKEAVAKLKKRYGNPYHLIGLYAYQLVSLPAVKPGDLDGFRKVVDQFEDSLHHILTLAEEISKTNPTESIDSDPDDDEDVDKRTVNLITSYLLAPILLRQLPHDVVLEWNRNHEKDRYHLRRLMRYVEQELENREALQASDQGDSSKISQKPQQLSAKPKSSSFSSSYRSTGAALHVHDSTSTGTSLPSVPDNRQKSSCEACGKGRHRFKDCRTFSRLTPEQRVELLIKNNRCVRCIGAHPRTNPGAPCPNIQVKCTKCGKPHHWLLCSAASTDLQASVVTPAGPPLHSTSNSVPIGSSCPPIDPQVTSFSTSSVGSSDEVICLKIVRSQIWSSVLNTYEEVYIYLDDGAKRTYIREDLATRLSLPIRKKETLSTGAFGGKVYNLLSSEVEFQLTGLHDPWLLQFTAWTAPTLCVPIQQVDVPDIPPALTQFAPWGDKFDGGIRDISIIIGADHLSRVTQAFLRIAGYPTVVDTFFGSVFFGPFPGQLSSSNLQVNPSFCAAEPFIQKLWDLESAGFEDPVTDEKYPDPLLENGRYTVQLPFKGTRRPACNLWMVSGRQSRVLDSLNDEQRQIYQKKIHALVTDDVAEPTSTPSTDGYYLPHHCVWGRKPRVVYNGSAKDRFGISLNDCLDPGPNLLASLQDVLLRFRLRKYPVVADVKAAFHSLRIDPRDRKWLKFLWGQAHLQFSRVPFGLSSSPFLLHSTVIYHVRTYAPESLSESLLKSIYCDDVLRSEDEPESAKAFLKDSIDVLSIGGMELIPSESPAKVLGLSTDDEVDTLFVNLSTIEVPSKITRRTLLTAVAKVFDPLGFLCPFVLSGRLLLQESWGHKTLSWDDPLPVELCSKFLDWLSQIDSPPIVFPRWIHFQEDTDFHVFSDASCRAYAFVVYAVPPDSTPELFYAKSRAAPIKPPISIPRLELLGATLAARFIQRLKEEICTPHRIVVWTDSTCVLGWIQNGAKNQGIFVRNRLKTIVECAGSHEWRYVPTALNPADVASRGSRLSELDDLYRHGPAFLQQQEADWPKYPASYPALLVTPAAESPSEPVEPVLDLSRFGSLSTAVNCLALVLRFINNSRTEPGSRVLAPWISSSERRSALSRLIVEQQSEFYAQELKQLINGSLPRDSSLAKLHVELRNGILVVVPRTGTAPLPLVHPRSYLAELFVLSTHQDLLHQGAEATLAEIRRRIWIPTGRSLVRRLIHRCRKCKRYRALPYNTPESLLQPFRREPASPFHVTGIDFFGPVQTKEGTKAWVLLCTCASTRALHLELVRNCSAEETTRALRSFLSLRVKPFCNVRIRSDNARTFLKVSTSRFPLHFVDWIFIPVRSPSWGGWWERLVQTVKRSLRPTLHGCLLPFEELRTVLWEVTSVVNQRPLTHVSSDPNDLDTICPNDFLLGSNSTTPSSNLDPAACGPTDIRRSLLLRDKCNRVFWKMWTRNYLTSLNTWNRKRSTSKLPTVGDIALYERPCPRGQWPMVKVLELIPGNDGVPRAVKVLVRGKTSIVASNRLFPLEADVLQVEPVQSDTETPEDTTATLRPKSTQPPPATLPSSSTRTTSPNRTRSGRIIRTPSRFRN